MARGPMDQFELDKVKHNMRKAVLGFPTPTQKAKLNIYIYK